MAAEGYLLLRTTGDNKSFLICIYHNKFLLKLPPELQFIWRNDLPHNPATPYSFLYGLGQERREWGLTILVVLGLLSNGLCDKLIKNSQS